MEPILIFYGRWTIEVVELVLRAGAPALRLIVNHAGAADGTYLNPAVGTQLEANGREWILKVEASFDLQPFQGLEPVREFTFDPQRGITALVKASRTSSAFNAVLSLRLTSHDPELGARPTNRYDFTIPRDTYARHR
jgi:hypothetical protein